MAKSKHMQDARVLVGIDISKSRHEVLIVVPGKTRVRPHSQNMTLAARIMAFMKTLGHRS